MDRRTLLKAAAGGTAAAALAGTGRAAGGDRAMIVRSPGSPRHDYSAALKSLISYAEQDLAAAGAPGMTLCVVDADGFAAVKTLGWSDRDRRTPVRPTDLFQIASISKSFAAVCVHRLADEGKIDLDAPLARYLSDLPLPPEPITVQQVLSHTAGLPRSAFMFPRVPGGRLWTGFAPGSAFSYSNTGYELIGLLVQRITGKPYPLALRELVIKPLGITGIREALQPHDRQDYAIGYSPLDISGPNMPRVTLGQAQWLSRDLASGNIGITADGMTRYLKFLIDVGRGRGAPIFSDAAARRFGSVVEPAAKSAFGPGVAYASGLEVTDLDGRQIFHHTGGNGGFSSSLTVDPSTGVACFLSVNVAIAGYRPEKVGTFACRLMRQAREGGPRPTPGSAKSALEIPDADRLAGSYFGPNGERFDLEATSSHLFLQAGGVRGRVQRIANRVFVSDHPQFGAHFLSFEETDRSELLWYGPRRYGKGAVVPQPVVPAELAALQGTYVSSDLYSGMWRTIIAQGDRLVSENLSIFHTQNTLRRVGDHWRPESAESPCERIWFSDFADGVPQRLNVSGRDLWRFNAI